MARRDRRAGSRRRRGGARTARCARSAPSAGTPIWDGWPGSRHWCRGSGTATARRSPTGAGPGRWSFRRLGRRRIAAARRVPVPDRPIAVLGDARCPPAGARLRGARAARAHGYPPASGPRGGAAAEHRHRRRAGRARGRPGGREARRPAPGAADARDGARAAADAALNGPLSDAERERVVGALAVLERTLRARAAALDESGVGGRRLHSRPVSGGWAVDGASRASPGVLGALPTYVSRFSPNPPARSRIDAARLSSASQRPVKRGGALLDERRDALRGVLAGEHLAECALLRLDPGVQVAGPETRLISRTASGACPANLRAHASAVSSSSWSGTSRFASPSSKASSARIGSPRQVHLQRLGAADQAWEPLRAAETGDDPEVDLGLPEGGRLPRDAEVAAHRELAPAAECAGVDGGDRDDLTALHRAQEAVHLVEQRSRRRRRPSSVNALMSAPAQNSIGLADANTTARTSPSSTTVDHNVTSVRTTSGEIEFAGGRSSHAIATDPRRSSLTGSSSHPGSGLGRRRSPDRT